MNEAGHVPVLGEQVLAVLSPKPGQVVLDCTIGRAGHAQMILPHLGPNGRYIGLDADPANVAYARQRLADAAATVDVIHANFAHAPAVLQQLGIKAVDLLLADLGFASNQMVDTSRGLSFAKDGPLDMRLDPTLSRTAADLIRDLSQQELADLIYRYGEERLSRKIARKIVEQRTQSPINTTGALAALVRQAYGRRKHRSRIDPATRTFMALRIAVNDELGALEQLLDHLPRLVKPGGLAAIISFHSLEDRPVKQTFAALVKAGRGQLLTRKPIMADDDERAANPPSRSAKLRAIRLTETTA